MVWFLLALSRIYRCTKRYRNEYESAVLSSSTPISISYFIVIHIISDIIMYPEVFFIHVTCSCNNVSRKSHKKWFYSGVRVFISSLMSLAMDLKKKQTNYFHFWQSIRNQRREFAQFFHSPNISFHDAVLSSESLQETLIPFFVLLKQKQRNLLPF